LIFDHTDRGKNTIVIDDSTGGKTGVPLSDEIKDALTKANLPLTTPSRGDNANAGDAKTPGTTVANVAQQAYMADVASKVVLPMFKARNKPFVLVFWSRDPRRQPATIPATASTPSPPGITRPNLDGRHQERRQTPGAIAQGARRSRPRANTNIIVSADHGFSTISKESKTSPSAKISYDDTPKDFLPMGFLAIDLSKALNLPLFESQRQECARRRQCPSQGRQWRARTGCNKARSGGCDQRWIGFDLPAEQGQEAGRPHHQGAAGAGLRQRAVRGRQARTFPRHAADVAAQPQGQGGDADPVDRRQFPLLVERAARSRPTARSRSPTRLLRQGQGMHGSFSRGDTMNFMAAIGPDFKSG